MIDSETQVRLAAMTDEGQFERLAMAVLRESDPVFRLLIHTGVNVAGKTVRSPVDGIMFVPGADPPHMVVVHHTICERRRLEEKWLQGDEGSRPVGDLVKTAKIVREERARQPRLKATLILTTNQEPPEDLVRRVEAEAERDGIAVPIWSNSAIAHVLDTDATGQYLRRKFLKIDAERLSADLLHELSGASLEASRPLDPSEAWIDRGGDAKLAVISDPVTFVVAPSGHGKTIAGLRLLQRQHQAGRFALMLSQAHVAAAPTLEHAIEAALTALYPPLMTGAGRAALACATEARPLWLLVEDVAQSGQPQVLIEKLAVWGTAARGRGEKHWRVLCPVWPRIMRWLRDDVRDHVEGMALTLPALTRDEGARAVQRRVERLGQSLTLLDAAAVSASLGDDPLLIALADGDAAQPGSVIERFITNRLSNLAEQKKELSPSEYRTALHRLADEMLASRTFDLTMADIARWFASEPDVLRALRQLIGHGEVLAVAGDPANEVLRFRHDRVRDSILSSALLAQGRRGGPAPDVLAEPYFAEVIGAAVGRSDATWPALETVTRVNPLALFCAIQDIGEPSNATHTAIVTALDNFIKTDAKADQPGPALMAGLQILADTTSSQVLPLILACRTPFDFWACWARCRNGDLQGGLALCANLEPGTQFQGLDALINHLRQRHGEQIGPAIAALLMRPDLSERARTGVLRLAGHLSLPELGPAITAAWKGDSARDKHLADYMFAAVRCCGTDPKTVMAPICDAWAKLSDEPGSLGSSARNSVMTHVRFAFHRSMPSAAVGYLIERAAAKDLRWPITYLLHGVDHPDAVAFVVNEMARGYERAAAGGGVPSFGMMAVQEWSRRSELGGKTMSSATRERLQEMWQSPDVAMYRRKAALRLWSAVPDLADLKHLSSITAPATTRYVGDLLP